MKTLKSKILILSILIILVFLILMLTGKSGNEKGNNNFKKSETASNMGVCPPFNLYDEDGNIIDPVNNINSDVPYSPKQTCGKCHDYDKITKGFHFQQGKDEKPTEIMSKRYKWVTSPGNYGGNWCSPAPLYRSLAKKSNSNAKEIDMTSFDFITATCGYCHPGGGPLEFDRDGFRYDKKMKDSINKFISGGDNGFDGDYFKARWDETGVIEADCMLCHLPEYDYKHRNAMLDSLNFKWAATEGSGLGKIEGSIKSNRQVKVTYDLSKFDKEGKVSMHLVREPRNETCLNCHSKPNWKKRGTDFSPRRDVHLAAGMKCVDCHGAGENAPSELIRGKEEHQFGKGDDPSGNVRNDLDNTVRSCENCHLEGQRNAPIAKHNWLPPFHLDKIACVTCHIPTKSLKSALVQVSDVYNTGSKISPPPKRIWTFYDPDLNYYNHYGELNMFTAKDIPYKEFKPTLARYKNKIYPVNSVNSAWPGIYKEGEEGLDQPKMKDIYQMWTLHREDSTKYSLLSEIKDDNGDRIPEVNTLAEIDAFIKSVTEHLKNLEYDLTGKQIVWVNNDRVYKSSQEFFTMEKFEYESSPYASVYKFSHNVTSSNSALGINGCTDCHSDKSEFFFTDVVKYPFDGSKGEPVLEKQFNKMGYDGTPKVYSNAARYTGIFFTWLAVIVLLALFIHIILDFTTRLKLRRIKKNEIKEESSVENTVRRFNIHYVVQHFLIMISVIILILSAVFLWGLRYSGAVWAASLTDTLGGIDFWRIVHRIGAVLLIFISFYHIIYSLLHPEGRRDFILMLPGKKDFKDLSHNLLWFTGKRKESPKFGRFSYFEKFDYWAVFWGCVIMIGSGLAMWLPEIVKLIIPSASPVFFEVMKEAHSHEAILALLAIIIWHMYNVHLRPDRFPGTLFWMHGKISEKENENEHPLEKEEILKFKNIT